VQILQGSVASELKQGGSRRRRGVRDVENCKIAGKSRQTDVKKSRAVPSS